MKVDFSFEGIPAGRLLDVEGPPDVPGTYRYDPYRSLGHLRFREAIARAGFARAVCTTPRGSLTFRARAGAALGVLEIDDIEPPAA